MEELLRLYFQGLTSREEERRLKEFFALHEVPDSLASSKMMFDLWESAAKVCCPPDSSAAISALCNSEGESPHGRTKILFRRSLKWLCAATAAAVSVALLVYLLPEKRSSEIYCYLNGEPVTDIETARGQARMAVRLLNEGVAATRNGMEAAAQISKAIAAIAPAGCTLNAPTCRHPFSGIVSEAVTESGILKSNAEEGSLNGTATDPSRIEDTTEGNAPADATGMYWPEPHP